MDFKGKKVLWFSDGVKVGSEVLGENFLSQNVYGLVKMRDCGDVIEMK